jgi:hypothetical protein
MKIFVQVLKVLNNKAAQLSKNQSSELKLKLIEENEIQIVP